MRRSTTVRAAILFVLLSLTTAIADSAQNDAGTGADASNSSSAPTAVALGTTYTGRAGEWDLDWYQAPAASSAPMCVELDASQARSTGSEFDLATADGVRSVRYVVGPHGGADFAGGLAGRGVTSATFGTTSFNDAQSYSFVLSPYTPQSAAVVNPGSTLSTAAPVSSPCFGGAFTLGQLASTENYNLGQFAAGTVLVVTTAATSPTGLQVSLLDAAGNVVATSSGGGIMTTQAPTTGTYYVSATRSTSALDQIQYIVGVVSGGDPGSPCRPTCLLSH